MRILTIGGTFNPVHVGHVRLAIETTEALPFDRVEWLPCFSPRHKSADGILPFPLRAELLRIALADLPAHTVNDIESRLPVPSYTYQTLAALHEEDPAAERFFLLGQREFARLHKWYRGRDLVAFAEVVVALRCDGDRTVFEQTIAEAWPGSTRLHDDSPQALPAYRLASGRTVQTVRVPHLEISASLVRARWLGGRDLRLLVPADVLKILKSRPDDVSAAWAQKSDLMTNARTSR